LRSGKGWEIQQADQPAVAVAAMKMSLVFWKLKELEFTQVLPVAGAPKEKTPLFTLKLLGGEEKPLFSLSEFPGEKDQATVAFSQGEKTGTAVVPAKALGEFKEMWASLRAAGLKVQGTQPAGR
jgi:hypothetical protein